MSKETECNSETGITIGLIDSLMTIAHVLVDRDRSSMEAHEAMKDLMACDDMKRLMDIGELSSAKEYIQKQKKDIDALLLVIELQKQIYTKQ